MRPSGHLIASLTISAVLVFFTKSVSAGILCFFSGILVDLDHIIEYVIHHDWKGLTVKTLYQACEETESQVGELRFERLYLIFHAAEIALLLWAAVIYTKDLHILAIAIGYSLHLLLDCAANKVYPISYFMIWRVIKKFNSDKLIRKSSKN